MDLSEGEDLITCSVCLNEYDEQEKRLPKLLHCAHTLCLPCLEDIRCKEKIKCPLCRKEFDCPQDVATLPNNNATLYIMKLKEKMARIDGSTQAKEQSSSTSFAISTVNQAGQNKTLSPHAAPFSTVTAEPVVFPSNPFPTFRTRHNGTGVVEMIMELWGPSGKDSLGVLNILTVASSPYLPFIKQLINSLSNTRCEGLLDHKSISITRVVPGVLILIRFEAENKFSSVMRELQNSCNLFATPKEKDVANSYGQLGVTMLTTDKNSGLLTGWSFLFPLENFCNPSHAAITSAIPPAFLFGRRRLLVWSNLIQSISSTPETEISSLKLNVKIKF